MNDKSHLTTEMKSQIKARLERIEDEEDAAESELIIYSDDDDDNDNDGRKLKERNEAVVGVDIFSDDDHRFKVREDEDESEVEDRARPLSSLSLASSPSRNAHGKSTRTGGHKTKQAGQDNKDQTDGWKRDEGTLCEFYLADPAVFLPRARASKARLDLKSRLTFSTQDDLIEAWKVMFDRNVRLSLLSPRCIPVSYFFFFVSITTAQEGRNF